MEPAIVASIHLPRRRAPSSKLCHAAAATFATVRPIQRTGKVWISTPRTLGHACPRGARSAARCRLLYCGPPAFMSDLTAGLTGWGVAANRIHTEIFGAGPSDNSGHRCARRVDCPTLPDGAPARDRWSLSPVAVSMFAGGRRSKACSSWPKRATYLCDGRVERASATLVRPDLWQGRSATGPTRSMHRRTAMC